MFLYFIETGKSILTPDDLTAHGLGYLLDGEGPDCKAERNGPGGAGGVVFTMPGKNRSAPNYLPAEQSWRKCPAAKVGDKKVAVWVGLPRGAKPGPDALARKRMRDGTPVRLRDGNDWIVPRCVAELEGRHHTLPMVLDLDEEDGETVIGKVDPRYESLCARAFDFWLMWGGWMAPDDPHRLKAQQQIALAADALAVNYRVSKVEIVAMLSLWSTDEYGAVLRAMIDADEVEAYYKAQEEKKSTLAASGSVTNSGATESSGVTSPDLQISPGGSETTHVATDRSPAELQAVA